MIRRIAPLLLAAAAALVPSVPVAQGAWPTRPIRLIVPFPPGGNTDWAARFFAERIQGELGQPIVVENRAGAGAMIGTVAAARSAPDGHTLLMINTGTFGVAPALKDPGFDPLKDFAPVAIVSWTYSLVAARRDLPAADLNELRALASKAPGTVSCGSSGIGTATHLACEQLGALLGVKFLHVPYKGSAPSLNDLIGGQIDVTLDPGALPQVKAGKVKALATNSQSGARHPELPDVRTVGEQIGRPLGMENWFGFVAPAGTPRDAIDRLAAALRRAVDAPDTTAKLLPLAQAPGFMGPAEFDAQLRRDIPFYGDMVRRLGLKAD